MHAFTRLTSFLLFVLSLNFLVCARPTSVVSGPSELAVRDSTSDNLVNLLDDLHLNVISDAKALGRFFALAE
jgi:hypothetical protein